MLTSRASCRRWARPTKGIFTQSGFLKGKIIICCSFLKRLYIHFFQFYACSFAPDKLTEIKCPLFALTFHHLSQRIMICVLRNTNSSSSNFFLPCILTSQRCTRTCVPFPLFLRLCYLNTFLLSNNNNKQNLHYRMYVLCHGRRKWTSSLPGPRPASSRCGLERAKKTPSPSLLPSLHCIYMYVSVWVCVVSVSIVRSSVILFSFSFFFPLSFDLSTSGSSSRAPRFCPVARFGHA